LINSQCGFSFVYEMDWIGKTLKLLGFKPVPKIEKDLVSNVDLIVFAGLSTDDSRKGITP